MIKMKCEVCGKEVNCSASRSKQFKTCSKECMGIRSRSNYNTTCDICGKTFHKKESHKQKSKNNFCSRKCHGEWRSENTKGMNNGNFRNSWIDDGYENTYSTTHGRIKTHQLVALNTLHIDSIPNSMPVHHRDCNKRNNIPENLVVLSVSDHKWMHHQFGSAALNAYFFGKIDLDTLVGWSDNKERAARLLPLNLFSQIGFFNAK